MSWVDRRGNEIYIYHSSSYNKKKKEKRGGEEEKGKDKNTTTHHTKKKEEKKSPPRDHHCVSLVFCNGHYSLLYWLWEKIWSDKKNKNTLSPPSLSASTFSVEYVITVLHVFPIDYQKRYLMRYNTTTLTVAIHTMDHRSVFIIYLFIIIIVN